MPPLDDLKVKLLIGGEVTRNSYQRVYSVSSPLSYQSKGLKGQKYIKTECTTVCVVHPECTI